MPPTPSPPRDSRVHPSAQSRAALTALVPEARREALAEALSVARGLIDPSEPVIRSLAPGDAGWIIGTHGALYARDEGYDLSFEALVARILAEFLDRADPLSPAFPINGAKVLSRLTRKAAGGKVIAK